ncbi:MAG: pyridoxamine 5'-phosphate oxidase [Planctomycetota bacterium]
MTLCRADLPAEPVSLLRQWLEAAREADLIEPSAAALATVGIDGGPSCRMVLVRDADAQGVVFYTNYQSRKGVDLAQTQRAALTLWWPPLERQLRVEGYASRVSEAESDVYFASRSRDSQISAAASPQSRPLRDRAELEERIAELAARHPDEVPRPAHWGGVRVSLEVVEFWQGAAHRRHDRLVFRRRGELWDIERLAP